MKEQKYCEDIPEPGGTYELPDQLPEDKMFENLDG